MSNESIKTLQEFYSNLKNKGLRTDHQFSVELPTTPLTLQDVPIYAASTNLPGRQITNEGAFFYGFPFQIITNTTYTQEWSLTIRSDVKMTIRDAFEEWSNQSSDIAKNTGGQKGIITNAECKVHLLDNDMQTVVKTYTLVGAFCSNIGEMTLDHNSSSISTFPVTIAFQYWYSGTVDPLK